MGNTLTGSVLAIFNPAHPHARGEHELIKEAQKNHAGSSPRTWGTHLIDNGLTANARLIPTHVGNTGPGRAVAVGGAAHPHARGEHVNLAIYDADGTGSSPRTWGTLYNTQR